MVGRMVDVPRPDRRDTQASPQRKVGSPEPARKTMSTTSGVERVTLQVHSGRLPTTEGGPRTEEVNSQVHMGLTSTKIPADLLRAEMRRMALYSHVTLSSTPSTEWETRFGDAATITVSMATLAPADMRRAARANVEWGKCPTDRPKQVAAPCDSTRSASESRECGGILFRSGTGQIFLPGQAITGMRGTHQPRHPLHQPGASGLMNALVQSPDDVLIQLHPAWTIWLRDHRDVEAEWATTWYAYGRVPRVAGYLAPEWDWYTGTGLLGASQAEQDMNSRTGVAAVRGWMGLPGRKRRDTSAGRLTEAFKYLLKCMGNATRDQYLWVATATAGYQEVQSQIDQQQARIAVVLRIPPGRAAIRESFAQADQRASTCKDWGQQARGTTAEASSEGLLLLRIGTKSESFRPKRRQSGGGLKTRSRPQTLEAEQLKSLLQRHVHLGAGGIVYAGLTLQPDNDYLQVLRELLGYQLEEHPDPPDELKGLVKWDRVLEILPSVRNSKGETLEPEIQYTLGDLITRAREVPRAVALMGALSDAHSRLLSHVYGTGNGEGRAAVNHTMAVTRSAIRANYHTHIAYYLQERCTFHPCALAN